MGLIICKGGMQYLELLLLFSCFCLKFSIAIDTITVTQPATDREKIISSNKVFQLGFFNPVNTTNCYVGIWYNNVPVRTVVWVANRDMPLTNCSSGTLIIAKDGNLVLWNEQKEVIWSSNALNSAANSSAQLLDTGNLVLKDNSNGNTRWESFKYPSDSFIHKMELISDASTGEKRLLKSWKSPSDPSVGSFSGGINLLTIPEFYIWNGSHPHWRTGPWDGQIFIGVQDLSSSYHDFINLKDNKEGTVSIIGTYTATLTYLVLSHQGTLLKMLWNKGKQEFEVAWSVPAERDVYGKCGPFGSCNSKVSPICSCLRGFEPAHVEEWNSGNFTGGCTRRTALQCQRNISSSSQESRKDGFLKLTTMKVPELPEWSSALADECENQCLKNCSCTAYVYKFGIGCMLWNGNLIDMQKFSFGGADLYIRVAYSELDKIRNMKAVIAISVIIGSIIIVVCTYISWKWIVKHRGMKNKSNMKVFKKWSLSSECNTEMLLLDNLNRIKLEELPLFDFEKLAIATNEFHETNKLGQGGFGPVYKGKLPDGQEIAVKRLSRSSDQGLEEFMNEVVVISKLQHRNLVKLLGCCVEGEEKMLIYEYMPNKSLDAFLFDPKKQKLLYWSKRLNIIEGIGRGLLYLHRDSRLRIIHRDLKASNILLDEELNPKISDFGMARIFGSDEHQANTKRVVGTYGYMAPEYAMQGSFSEKSDVFSFGVLLLEIVSGRRNTSFYDDEQALSLLGYAWKLWNEDKIVTLIDPRISCQDFGPEILRCIHVGLLCVQEFAIDRPTISAILSMLSNEISYLLKPKQPAFTERPTTSKRQSSQNNQSRCSRNELTNTTVDGR
ncbi:G-type lectin S-receptor-like serine/threonine-protein kinase [Camellia lanceoleosa]|uniref:G-type lectin S-receptor-like serine/threonine-protein kinase n=1 Tax=Camellia lanceoleosa TaxID=1840588 RepID=A0ACC0I8L9_9ERIC|nr:G-type lectin S-receptor-like serine/threonine-protein kinase [Camellia lanceoleosa]